ncbi:SRPBCC domain-containing protein [Arenibacter sp. M-2]|uniref:SRPBCC family protein n=1 Tax=Arenibacter sp. M-2 TaxID=3053612 RepID=UPI002570CB7B|nr:SRPBCC domain-containing protein [Arenibacter sp. M-2]MDL5513315.1 SRPBCC domain-containing protein [Arenibacter sp. M-2]
MKTEIKHKWFYHQSSKEIWEFLTKAELIEKWLMPNNFELKLGHEFKFTTNPIPSLNLDGNFYCKVLEIIPLKKLVYSWNGGLSKNNPTLETIVEWTLETKDKGTELTLVHSGFKEGNSSILTAMFDGWDKNIQKMFTNLTPH